MSERTWGIVIDKREIDDDEEITTIVVTVSAPTAQQALKHLVDMTTNNARVIRVSIEEVTPA